MYVFSDKGITSSVTGLDDHDLQGSSAGEQHHDDFAAHYTNEMWLRVNNFSCAEPSRREKIVAGIDPETGLPMSIEQWHTKLILMSANLDEYEPYRQTVERGK